MTTWVSLIRLKGLGPAKYRSSRGPRGDRKPSVVARDNVLAQSEKVDAVFLELDAVVRNHGGHLLLVFTGEQRVAGDDGRLWAADDERKVPGHVARGHHGFQPIGQRLGFDPAKLRRLPQPLRVPPAEGKLAQPHHVLARL